MQSAQDYIQQVFDEAEAKINRNLKHIQTLESRGSLTLALTPPGLRPPHTRETKDAIQNYKNEIREWASLASGSINDRLHELSERERQSVKHNIVKTLEEKSGLSRDPVKHESKEQVLSDKFQTTQKEDKSSKDSPNILSQSQFMKPAVEKQNYVDQAFSSFLNKSYTPKEVRTDRSKGMDER